MTILDKIIFKLFDEWRFVYTFSAIGILITIIIGYMACHFIHKYW
jgi:hypothetical protein